MAQARAFYERALALDPGNIDALVGAASVEVIVVGVLFVKDRATRLARAEKALTEALSSAPEHAAAHLQMGVVHTLSNRAAQGIAEFERALALDHNLATAHAYIGFAEYVDGRAGGNGSACPGGSFVRALAIPWPMFGARDRGSRQV